MVKLQVKTPESFIKDIENLVEEFDISYMDAILMYCENNGLEVETVSTLVKRSTTLKAKLQLEAEDLNLVRRAEKSARLPI
jgi:hypothetical protein